MRNRTVKVRLLLCIAAASLLATGVLAAANRGADQIVIDGGKAGDTPFPHHRHQDTLKDCNLCHNLFPQEAGAIEKLKLDGTLRNKQVMKQCQSCHRKMAREGQKSGPTSCKKCHSIK
jgi:hypothetical protein